MKCERCGGKLDAGEEIKYMGQVLCEDCYMDVLSPTRVCDPWAVYSAKSEDRSGTTLTDVQEKVLEILKETGGLEPDGLAKRLGLKTTDVQRELAALRHMEKVRAAMKGGKKVFCLW